MKALILRDEYLGDIVMTASVIDHLLKAGYTQIDWISNTKALGLKKWLPACKNIYMLKKGREIALQLPLLLRIRKQKYNLMIIFERSTRYYQLIWIIRPKIVLSFFMNKYLTWGIDRIWKWDWNIHDTKNYNGLIRLLWPHIKDAKPRLQIPEEPYSPRMKHWFKTLKENKINVIIHPGTSQPAIRGYPPEQYKEIISLMLKQQENIQIIFSGSYAELEPYRDILKDFKDSIKTFFHDAEIEELCALISWGDLLISVDTGPMHISEALGKHQVALFGPTSYEHTGSLNNKALVLHADFECCPCIYTMDKQNQDKCRKQGYPRCYKTLTPEFIIESMRERWGNSSAILLKVKLS